MSLTTLLLIPPALWMGYTWGGRSPDPQLLTHAHPGAIVDLHDAPGVRGAPERLLAALPSVLSGLSARGYELVPLGTLLSGA